MVPDEAQQPPARRGAVAPTKPRLVCPCGASLAMLGRADRQYAGQGSQIVRRGPTVRLAIGGVEYWGCPCSKCGVGWRVDAADVYEAQEAGHRSINVGSLPSAGPWPPIADDPLRAAFAAMAKRSASFVPARLLADAHNRMDAARKSTNRSRVHPAVAVRRRASPSVTGTL